MMGFLRKSEFPLLDLLVIVVPLLTSTVAWFCAVAWVERAAAADRGVDQHAMVAAGMLAIGTFVATLLLMAILAFVLTIVLRRRAKQKAKWTSTSSPE